VGRPGGPRYLKSGCAVLLRADAEDIVHIRHEYLAVSNLVGLGRLDDGGYRILKHLVIHHHGDEHLRDEIDGIFAATVDFRVPALSAVALALHDRHSVDTHLHQGHLDFIKFEWPYDCFNFFHDILSVKN